MLTMNISLPAMNISLPHLLKTYVDEQVAGRGYGTSSEYMRELSRKDQDRQRLRALLLEGAESEPASAADAACFERLRARSQGHFRGPRKMPSMAFFETQSENSVSASLHFSSA